MARRGYGVAFVSLLMFMDEAHAVCPKGWFDVEDNAAEGRVTLIARNNSQVPLTFTLEVDMRRLVASRDTTFTESIGAGEERPVIVLDRKDPDNKGRYWYRSKCTIGNVNADHDDDVMYLMPYETGKSYRVLQGYGSTFSHTGRETYAIDFNMPEGTPVHAARGGFVAVIEESHNKGCWENGCGRYANYIVIVHADETTGEYYHLQQNGALVEAGDQVTAGQLIGLSGNTGHSTMPHLHFGVYRADDWGREQSIPVRFATETGVVDRPRRGGRYFAIGPADVARQMEGLRPAPINSSR